MGKLLDTDVLPKIDEDPEEKDHKEEQKKDVKKQEEEGANPFGLKRSSTLVLNYDFLGVGDQKSQYFKLIEKHL